MTTPHVELMGKHTVKTITDQVEATFRAIDDLWRVELLGNAALTQRWRAARNEAATLRENWRDLLRLSDYLRARASQTQPDPPKPPPASTLPLNGASHRQTREIPRARRSPWASPNLAS